MDSLYLKKNNLLSEKVIYQKKHAFYFWEHYLPVKAIILSSKVQRIMPTEYRSCSLICFDFKYKMWKQEEPQMWHAFISIQKFTQTRAGDFF